MSDHWTRMHANPVAGQVGDMVVLGCLLGSQTGRTVDISNSFEIKWTEGPDGSMDVDTPFLLKKQEQCECGQLKGGETNGLAPHWQRLFPPFHGALLLLLLLLSNMSHTHTADKAVFPKQDLVGWYVTGAQLEPRHMALHRKVGPGDGGGGGGGVAAVSFVQRRDLGCCPIDALRPARAPLPASAPS